MVRIYNSAITTSSGKEKKKAKHPFERPIFIGDSKGYFIFLLREFGFYRLVFHYGKMEIG